MSSSSTCAFSFRTSLPRVSLMLTNTSIDALLGETNQRDPASTVESTAGFVAVVVDVAEAGADNEFIHAIALCTVVSGRTAGSGHCGGGGVNRRSCRRSPVLASLTTTE